MNPPAISALICLLYIYLPFHVETTTNFTLNVNLNEITGPSSTDPVSPSDVATTRTSAQTPEPTPSSTPLVSQTTSRPVSIEASTSSQTPLVSTTKKPLADINPLKTKFLLYTRSHSMLAHHLVSGDNATVRQAEHYNPNQPTRFIIHGGYDGVNMGHWMRDMKNKLLEVEDVNVIIVDWSASSAVPATYQRLSNVRMVGHQIAKLIEDMGTIHGTKRESVHIIAHGDGTFAADALGRRVTGLGRITGLNPSGPNIDNLPSTERLDKTDANFVDIIHTDYSNASLSLYRRGTSLNMGHVDFYPNGGVNQPGCNIDELQDLIKKAFSEGLRTFLSCSHYRAIEYFIESITPSTKCLHLGYECKSYTNFLRGECGHCHNDQHLCAEMGLRTNLYTENHERREGPIKLFYSTSTRKPYCLYHYNVQVNIAAEPEQTRGGTLKLTFDGENGQMPARINGGSSSFKAGFTTGLITTHDSDVGSISGVNVNWAPHSLLSLLQGENLYIDDIRIAPIGWAESKLRTEAIITMCPSKSAIGMVAPFYGQTYFQRSNNCTLKFH